MRAEKWLTRLFDAIFSLDEELPARLPGHRGSERAWLSRPRHLLYGKRRGVCRIIFHIREDQQHVRTCSEYGMLFRDAITAADVEE